MTPNHTQVPLAMQCRENCGACCIAPSINALNKPANTRCQHLTETLRCAIFNSPERPQACADFLPEPAFCGENSEQAMQILSFLEESTAQGN